MFFIKKSKKSKYRFFLNLSTYFSFKKKQQFSYNLKKTNGRNNTGSITVKHRKTKLKNKFLAVNLKRCFLGLKFLVTEICFWKRTKPYLILVKNKYNSLSYFIAPDRVFINFKLYNCLNSFFFLKRKKLKLNLKKIGTLLFIKNLNTGDVFINLIFNNAFFFYANSGGTYLKINYISHCKSFFSIFLPSGKKFNVPVTSLCVLGRNSNKSFKKKIIGSFKLNKYFGLKPSVRGVAMNPVDHPNGGRTKSKTPEKSPWGWIAKLKK